MGFIYKITNNLNGQIYIGQTIKARATDRFSQHKYLATHPEQEKGRSYLHKAMALEGIENFSFKVIEEVANEELNIREQYWIQYYNSLVPNGYNLTIGGEGTVGFKRPQSSEEKLKRQASNKAYYKNHPEAAEARRLKTLELWQDEDYRKRVTESNKKFYAEHPDIFKGENNPFYGKHHSEESLKKIKEASKSKQKKIAQIDKDTGEIIKIHDGVKDAEKDLGVSHGWISKAARANKIAYGFKWKFVESVTTND